MASSLADEIEYKLDTVPAKRLGHDEIDTTFRSTCIGGGRDDQADKAVSDLTSATLGGKILGCSDEWFAPAENLLTPTAPISQPGKMVYTGAWYDGWETRRHNKAPFDWVVIRLGVASGTVEGVEVDTAFFTGNYAPAISVEGCFSDSDEEVLGWQGGRGRWETILGLQELGPSQRHGWKLEHPTSTSTSGSDSSPTTTKQRYTHVRLNQYPDGGIARFRLFGHAVPVFPADAGAVLDLAAAQNGGVAVSCSDQHYGTKDNLILPGRGKDMADGWETKRSRGKEHVDWAVIKLGARGVVERLVVDTAHFRGNFPQRIAVYGLAWDGDAQPGERSQGWMELVPPSETGPDREHEFESLIRDTPLTHVKLVMIPDGGVKRLRVFGKRAA